MKQYSGEEGNSNNLKEATTTTASSPKTVSSEIVTQIETSKTTRSHLRVLALSGAGVFMDGYDLFIISVALIPIRVAFHTTPLDISAISSCDSRRGIWGRDFRESRRQTRQKDTLRNRPNLLRCLWSALGVLSIYHPARSFQIPSRNRDRS